MILFELEWLPCLPVVQLDKWHEVSVFHIDSPNEIEISIFSLGRDVVCILPKHRLRVQIGIQDDKHIDEDCY